MDLLMNGGWVMSLLVLCSFISVAIIIQKLILLRMTVVEKNFIQDLKNKLMVDSMDQVIKEYQYSRKVNCQIAAITLQFYNASEKDLGIEIQSAIKKDISKLNEKMDLLSIIITSAPVLGLLGTVLGLMDVFSVIATDGIGQAELLSAGISKALVTTVAGLIIAIPLMFIYQFLQSKIEQRLDEWDFIPKQLVSFCKQQR